MSRDAGTGAAASIATAVMTYDALNRLTAAADADDASLAGSCSKTPGIAGSSIVTRTTYYADGSVATTQTPSEAARNSGTVYTYDLDGNQISDAPYTGNAQNAQTPRMKRWFDGADRLVETQEPADPATPGDIPVSLRYVYDLSKSGAASTLSGASVVAHGNLFNTEKNTPTGWIDFKYAAFDAADRPIANYAFAPCPAQSGPTGAIYCNQSAFQTRYAWDSSSWNPNAPAPRFVVATQDGAGAFRLLTYDGLGHMDTINYAGDNGVTTPVSYYFDADGRLAQSGTNVNSWPQYNTVSFTYNADGTVQQEFYSSLNTSVSYSYYADSMLAGIASVATRNSFVDVVNQPNLYQYAYRNDGLLTAEAFGVSNQSVSVAYTRGGRSTTLTDFSGSPSLIAQYGDGYGQLSSLQTPSGTYASIMYDAQGRMTQYTDPFAGTDGETVSSTYNIRGDLVARAFSGGSAVAKPGFAYKNIQGVLVQNASDQYDGRTGAPLRTYAAGVFQYDAVGRLINGGGALGYDAESRLVSGDTWNASSAEDSDCHSGGALAPGLPPPPGSRELTYQYDGLGRLFQDKSQDGTTRQWIFNGDASLYTLPVTVNGNGYSGMSAPFGYAADGFGSIIPGAGPGLTIADHFDGGVAQYHNRTGHSAWAATNTYNPFCQHANPLPATSGYNGSNNVPAPADGSSDPGVGVTSYGRGYLSHSMGYTTPEYNSVTPYSSGRRVSDYCVNNPDGTRTVVKDPEEGGHIDSCAHRYVPPSVDVYVGGGDWSFLPNFPPTCRGIASGNVPSSSLGDWASGVDTAGSMTANWAAGTSPAETIFGPGTVPSNQMMGSYGLAANVKAFLAGGPSSGVQAFGLGGLWSTGANPTGQFVGSYGWSMSQSGGRLSITITNSTTAWSAFYHPRFLNPNPPTRSGWSPMGRVNQTFFIDVPCP